MMKSKGIILIAMLCIVAISGCSKETNTTAADSETSSTQITTSESISAGETSVKNRRTMKQVIFWKIKSLRMKRRSQHLIKCAVN